MRYRVKGADESVENVDILGEVRKVGDEIELEAEVATPLVEEGKLEFVGEESQGENTLNAPETPQEGGDKSESGQGGEQTV